MNRFETRYIENSVIEIITKTGKAHVAIVAGGMSAEREVSLVSGKYVTKSLVELGYRVSFVDMGQDIASVLLNLKPDIVYNCLHGTYGEDGCLPGLLNILRIPYTHSGVLPSALAFNKIYSKKWFEASNIKTPASIFVNKSQQIRHDPMRRPYVIKPLTQGSSIGVEVIFEGDDFDFAHYDFPYGDDILIEEYISGREMQVAVLNGEALGVLEIKLLKRRFYDYDTKYTEGFAEHLCPAPLEEALYNQLLKQSEKIFNGMQCKGVARVEFIFDQVRNEIFTLEINTHPGMTPLSIVPEIAMIKGITFTDLVQKILDTAAFE